MTDPQRSAPPRSEVGDAVTVLFAGAAAAAVIVVAAILRYTSTFRGDVVAWTLDIDDIPVQATLGSGAPQIDAIAEEATVLAEGVNTVSQVSIAASIAMWTLAGLIVVACVMFLAWSFLRGRFFVPATARSFDIMGWTIIGTTAAVLLLDQFGRNGVLAAIGAADAATVHPAQVWAAAPVWMIGIAVSLIGVAFRRGIRLQRDTEGLV